MTARKTILAIAALATAGALGACATSSDTASRIAVAPDKYVLYGCPQLAEARQSSLQRQRELEALMARASQSPGGRMMSALAYESEYAMVKGELREQARTAREKNCNAQPGRPASRQSDVIIR